jgi:hypothetical protein
MKLNIKMENNLIIMQSQGLRNIAKTITALKLQITQLESEVRKLRIDLAGGNKDGQTTRNY